MLQLNTSMYICNIAVHTVWTVSFYKVSDVFMYGCMYGQLFSPQSNPNQGFNVLHYI